MGSNASKKPLPEQPQRKRKRDEDELIEEFSRFSLGKRVELRQDKEDDNTINIRALFYRTPHSHPVARLKLNPEHAQLVLYRPVVPSEETELEEQNADWEVYQTERQTMDTDLDSPVREGGGTMDLD
jgi:hypothetical protein